MYPTHFPSFVPEEQGVMNVLAVYEEDSVVDLGNCKSVNQLSDLLSKTATKI